MEEKKVTWLELFYDLVFVAAISTATHVLIHVEDGVIHAEYFVKFIIMMIPIWWAWVGQTLLINRFGKDFVHQRLYMIVQMFFVLIMTSSLSVDFDTYYVPFMVGYIGLRVLTAIQYIIVQQYETIHHKKTAQFLGKYFWIGIIVSFSSVFFDSWIRYVIFYLGIFVDILVPIFGRKYLVKAPINIGHLLERFGLLTIILFGELIISTIVVLQPEKGNFESISYAVMSFIVIIAMWWQYFDNIDKKIDKSIKSAGQLIVYGHLIIFITLSMIAAFINMIYLHDLNYLFMIGLLFFAVILYFFATTLVFHMYRYEHHRLKINHLGLFVGLISIFLIIDIMFVVPRLILMMQIAIFFLVYAKVTTT
ncbi:low temperature requirement protein A [Bacillus sp. SCS-151]|uniref:low temperature requirement protein A n=1 Tax=Nanhaiella sioensis TaxID=3115293 RepID=UPI00397DB236